MSSAASRAFSTSGKRLMKRVGGTAAELAKQNPGVDLTAVNQGLDSYQTQMEEKVITWAQHNVVLLANHTCM